MSRWAAAQPLAFRLPGGLIGRVCTKRDAYPDGTEWDDIGIQPTLLVRPTVTALQAGQDPVLAATLRQLGAPPAPPARRASGK